MSKPPKMQWQLIKTDGETISVKRAKVPRGWLVWVIDTDDRTQGVGGLTFYPDPGHQWDGSSLP